MQRGKLLLTAALVVTACGQTAPPQIGVMVSTAPRLAAEVAAEEQVPGDPGYFVPLTPTTASPVSAEAALDLAHTFTENQRVIAVVGHGNSAASLAASPIYNAAGLVQIAPTTTAPVYSDAGAYSFRMVPSDTFQADFIAHVVAKRWPAAARIAVVYVNDDYGRGLFRQLRPKLNGLVFEGVYADNADEWEFTELSRQIAPQQPDLLIWLGRSRPLGLTLEQLRASVPELDVVCADGCDGTMLYRNEGGVYDGVVFVRFTDPRGDDERLRSFRTRYLEYAGEPPSSEALLTYDAVSLVRAALRAGARTREQVREYLVSLGRSRPPFEGLTGSISFDSTGTVSRAYLLAEVVGPDSVVPIRTGGR